MTDVRPRRISRLSRRKKLAFSCLFLLGLGLLSGLACQSPGTTNDINQLVRAGRYGKALEHLRAGLKRRNRDDTQGEGREPHLRVV